jgi:hypothetical protein
MNKNKILTAMCAFGFRQCENLRGSEHITSSGLIKSNFRLEDLMFRPRLPRGKNKYTFEDGFECYALNQKNANRKHLSYKKSL